MWILLVLLAALLTAGREALFKRGMRHADAFALVAGVNGVVALITLPLLLLGGVPELSRAFWLALLASGSINAVAQVLIARAVQASDLSLVSPLQSFTPAFMLLTAPLILGEWPTPIGGAGVLTLVAGAYLLNVRERRRGPLAPLKALVADPGARMMLAVALLYSVSASVDKVGVLASSALAWTFGLNAFVGAALVPLALRALTAPRREGAPYSVLGDPRVVVLAGLFTAVALVAQFTALAMTLAAYVIAVKRTSILFSVLMGALLFRESGLSARLLGAAVMLVGFLLITLA